MCTDDLRKELCLFQQRGHKGSWEHLRPSFQGGIHRPKSPPGRVFSSDGDHPASVWGQTELEFESRLSHLTSRWDQRSPSRKSEVLICKMGMSIHTPQGQATGCDLSSHGVPCFPHLYNVENNHTCLEGALWWLYGTTYVKH